MNNALFLVLEHQPSETIEHGYNVDPIASADAVRVPVSDLEDAQVKFCAFIGKNGLSGTNLTARSGAVVNEDGHSQHQVLYMGDLVKRLNYFPGVPLLQVESISDTL